jgi:hypothetical protein
MQDERLIADRLDSSGQLRLIGRGIDMGITMVFEDPKVSIQTNVNARRLDQISRVRFQSDAAGIDLGLDVAVGEQHGATLPR